MTYPSTIDSGEIIDRVIAADETQSLYNVVTYGAVPGTKASPGADATSAFQDAIDAAKQQTNPNSALGTVIVPPGWWVCDSAKLTIDAPVRFVGAGAWQTVIYSKDNSDWLFDIDADRCHIEGFTMFHSTTGGIRLYRSHRSAVVDVFVGMGTGAGPSFVNVGSQDVYYERCIVSTNGSQMSTGTGPTYGFDFMDAATAGLTDADGYVVNVCLMVKCTSEGATVRNFRNRNDTTAHAGQGYMHLKGCTFQGAIPYNIELSGCNSVHFFGCHTEGGTTGDIFAEDLQALGWHGGTAGAVVLEGVYNSVFDGGTRITALSEDSDCQNNDVDDFIATGNAVYDFNEETDVGNFNRSLLKSTDATTSLYQRNQGYGQNLVSNGNFVSWPDTTLPLGFTNEGPCTIARDTGEASHKYACSITAIGATSVQGLRFDLEPYLTSLYTWITVSFLCKRPTANDNDIKIVLDISFDRVITINKEELTADTYVLVSASFLVQDRAASFVTICPAFAPSGGEQIIIDDLVIKTGKVAPVSYMSNAQSEVAILDKVGVGGAEKLLRRIQYDSAGTTPVAGNFADSDIVLWPAVRGGRLGTIAIDAIVDASADNSAFAEFGDIVLAGSDTWDAANIAIGGMEAKDVTVTGAALGDYAIASMGVDVTDLTISASVTAADTVTVVLANNTAGGVNLGSTTVRARVFKA